MKKTRPIKNTWYDWLITDIPDLKRRSVGGFKNKIVSLFKTKTLKQVVYGRGKKLNKPKTQKQFKENIINSIRNIFILKHEKKKKNVEQLKIE